MHPVEEYIRNHQTWLHKEPWLQPDSIYKNHEKFHTTLENHVYGHTGDHDEFVTRKVILNLIYIHNRCRKPEDHIQILHPRDDDIKFSATIQAHSEEWKEFLGLLQKKDFVGRRYKRASEKQQDEHNCALDLAGQLMSESHISQRIIGNAIFSELRDEGYLASEVHDAGIARASTGLARKLIEQVEIALADISDESSESEDASDDDSVCEADSKGEVPRGRCGRSKSLERGGYKAQNSETCNGTCSVGTDPPSMQWNKSIPLVPEEIQNNIPFEEQQNQVRRALQAYLREVGASTAPIRGIHQNVMEAAARLLCQAKKKDGHVKVGIADPVEPRNRERDEATTCKMDGHGVRIKENSSRFWVKDDIEETKQKILVLGLLEGIISSKEDEAESKAAKTDDNEDDHTEFLQDLPQEAWKLSLKYAIHDYQKQLMKHGNYANDRVISVLKEIITLSKGKSTVDPGNARYNLRSIKGKDYHEDAADIAECYAEIVRRNGGNVDKEIVQVVKKFLEIVETGDDIKDLDGEAKV